MERTIIALCGPAGCGKDEAARALRSLGFTKRSFAELLRREVKRMFTDPQYRREMRKQLPDAVDQAFLECYDVCDFDPWEKPTRSTMRVLLQRYGTEFRRAQDADYWVDAEAVALPESGLFVYTDCRFPNEYEMVRSLGGLVFRVECPWAIPLDHESERYWPHFAVDGVIRNDGTVDELHAAAIARISAHLCTAAAPSSLPNSAASPNHETSSASAS